MNPGELSVRNNRVVFVAMFFVLLGGIVGLPAHGPARGSRVHDQGSADHHALSRAPAPRRSPRKSPTRSRAPASSWASSSGSSRSPRAGGRWSPPSSRTDFTTDAIPQVWDELRRKIADVQPQLPPAVRGKSMVVDDFGDVYGIFLAITGDGYSQAELRRYTEFLRRELLLVPDVKKVDLFGEQQEVVFLEISRQRLAQLGINEEQIYANSRRRTSPPTAAASASETSTSRSIRQAEFRSADEMLELVIGSDRTGRQLFLRDVATIERGDQDPPRRLLRYDGKPAIGLGISTVQGGNVVTMGKAVRRKLDGAQTQPADRHRDRRDQLPARGGHAKPPATSCSIWARRSPSSSSCSCSRWAARPG